MESFDHVIVYAVSASFAVMFLLWKTGVTVFRRCLGYEVLIDALFTVHMFSMFGFTFSGLVTAIIAGLTFSFFLRAARNWWGYERLTYRNRQLQWVPHNAKWRRFPT
jgi:hypothetical protein